MKDQLKLFPSLEDANAALERGQLEVGERIRLASETTSRCFGVANDENSDPWLLPLPR